MIGFVPTPERFRGSKGFTTENTKHHGGTRRIIKILLRGTPWFSVFSVVKNQAAVQHEQMIRRTLSFEVDVAGMS
jgi:hypothetical protein